MYNPEFVMVGVYKFFMNEPLNDDNPSVKFGFINASRWNTDGIIRYVSDIIHIEKIDTLMDIIEYKIKGK